MRNIVYLFIYFILGVFPIVIYGKETMVYYDVRYQAHGIGCLLDLNNKILLNTAEINNEAMPYMFVYTQGITPFVNEGLNVFSLRGLNVAYQVEPESISNFYCKVTVIASVVNPKTQSVERNDLFSINLTMEEVEDTQGNKKAVIIANRGIAERGRELVGDINLNRVEKRNVSWESGEVSEIEAYWFDRSLDVRHVVPLSWVQESTPVEDTSEIRQLAYEKYHEIQLAIQEKDYASLKSLLEPGLTDMAKIKGITADRYFEQLVQQVFNGLYEDIRFMGWKAEPFNEDDYYFRLYADGKLFGFNHKRNNEASPVSWIRNKTRIWFTPVLTMIDDEVKVGAF